jgi:hypothetical protein
MLNLSTSVTAAACLLAASFSAYAAQRTFVSTSGADASPTCSLTAPCRSFGQAMFVTDSGGEIVTLDSGGYGSVAINRSVSIVAPPGVYAGISVFVGAGVSVNTPGVKVALRNLFINGQGGFNGIQFDDGAELHVDGCTVTGLDGYGIVAATGRILVHDSILRNNGYQGIHASNAQVYVDRARIEENGQGGILVLNSVLLVVRDSLIADNGHAGIATNAGPLTRIDVESTAITGNGQRGLDIYALTVSTKAEVTVARSTIDRNGGTGSYDGVYANGFAHVSVTDSTITGNYGSGLAALNGATIVAANNLVSKNAQYGFANSSSTFESRGDNTVQANFGAAASGAITDVSGL